MALIGKLSQYTTIFTTNINNLFSKLEEIRTTHSQKAGAFISNPPAFNTDIAQEHEIIDPTYPTTIKNYIEVLETSSYIPDTYSKDIQIPNSIIDYIKAAEYYNDYVDIINDIANICPHDSSYKGAYDGSNNGHDGSWCAHRAGDCAYDSANYNNRSQFEGLGANGSYDF